ncbi:MAG TPA: helix-hairpin-helix domain-containing protein [Bacillota bacterium]|nr:helix-hairpin-helix domain-containing protein [Bacillota bacterium]
MNWEFGDGSFKRKLAAAVIILVVLAGSIEIIGRKMGYWQPFAAPGGITLTADGQLEGSGNSPTESEGEQGDLAGAAQAGQAAGQTNQIAVYIVGAVNKPGVYYLPEGSRLHQLVEMAGAKGEAALSWVNLAQVLADGEQWVIPTLKEVQAAGNGSGSAPGGGRSSWADAADHSVSGAASAPPASAGGLININTATPEQLQQLPGIGPAYAERILEYRETNGPFKSIQDLTKVSGIGAKRLAQLEGRVTIR